MKVDNRKNITNDSDIDIDELKRFEKAFIELQDKMGEVFHEYAARSPKHIKFAAHAAIYAPVSFAFYIMELTDEMGIQPHDIYPTFVKVYANIARSLGKLEDEYQRLPWQEFNEKFAEFYTKDNHFAYDLDNYKKE